MQTESPKVFSRASAAAWLTGRRLGFTPNSTSLRRQLWAYSARRASALVDQAKMHSNSGLRRCSSEGRLPTTHCLQPQTCLELLLGRCGAAICHHVVEQRRLRALHALHVHDGRELRIEPGRQLRRRFDGRIRSPDTASVLGSTEREVEYSSKLRPLPLQAQPPLEEPGKMDRCLQAGWTRFTLIACTFTCFLTLSTHLHPRIHHRRGLLCFGSLSFHLTVAQVFGSWRDETTTSKVALHFRRRTESRSLKAEKVPPAWSPSRPRHFAQVWSDRPPLHTESHGSVKILQVESERTPAC